ncbi:hypothetical protein [Ferrimonas lipolytica]|uniref:Uncharacterized protein n=1 Tax=Ferrimonas lipolytica TaxID=2724191 RepID=A0A6H1UE03_9GAMM|nr:hypothetical protein [Ferrimonas lipolytica]QIZ77337.1 hypothetical protein HER31_10870 [Ferrimonas lipolytica]
MKATHTNWTTQWLPLLTAGLSIVTLLTMVWAVDKHLYAQELQQHNSSLSQQLEQQQQQQRQLVAKAESLLAQKQVLQHQLTQLRLHGNPVQIERTEQGLAVMQQVDGGIQIVAPQ